MSGTFSPQLEAALLNHVFGGPVFAKPSGIFVALFTVPPLVDGSGGVEVQIGFGGYSRQGVAFGTPTGSPPSMSNPLQVQWGSAGAPWGTITAGGLYDAPVGGSFFGGSLIVDPIDGVTPTPKVITTGDVFVIPPGNLVVGFTLPNIASFPGMRAAPVLAPIRGLVVPAGIPA